MRAIRSSIIVVGFVTQAVSAQHPPRPLIVHEWGTITTHHAADGTPEGGLNRIAPTEALPPFVHQYEPTATQTPAATPRAPLIKSPVTPGRPDVTMRLETPVMYFYPPSGSAAPPFDVYVRFRGGILNEFYPNADATSQVDVDRATSKMQAGVIKSWDGQVLNNYVVGSLSWRGVALTGSATLPRTTSHVWLAPRHVRSTSLMTPAGEAEQYLFYRGVAHLDALVQTELAPSELRLRAPANLQWLSAPATTINALWLVDIRPNGGSAFREIDSIVIAKDAAGRELRRSRRHAGDVGRELLSLAGVASPLHRAAGMDRVPLTRGDFDSARAHEGVGRANRSGAAVASGRSRGRRIAACRAHHGREPQNERNDRARARRPEEGKPNEDCRANADEADSQQCK